MNITAQKAKRVLPWGGLLFAFLLGAVLLVLLAGTGERDREVLLLEDAAQRWKPLCLAAGEEDVLLAAGDGEQGLLLRLDKAGHELSRQMLSFSPGWAGRTATSLLLRQDDRQGCVLLTLDPMTLEETDRETLPVTPRELMLFTADDSAAAWTTSAQRDRAVLWADGETREVEMGETVTALSAQGGVLRAAAGNTAADLTDPAVLTTLPDTVASLLPGSRALTRDGTVYTCADGTAAPAFQWASPVYGDLFFCPDGENGLILSTAAGEVSRLREDGAVTGTCQVNGTLLAVCGSGALLRRDGALRYVPLAWEDPAAAASPAPSTAPSAAPSVLPPGVPAVTEGSFLLLEEGTTVAGLRELFRPEAVEIRDASGLPVTRGVCATGMTANAYTLVIPGDCDGTGSVTEGDLRRAAGLLGDEEAAGSAYARAADLNSDGAVDGDDLLSLRALLGQ